MRAVQVCAYRSGSLMDSFFTQALSGLAGSGPFAILAMVVIYMQFKQIERLQTHLLTTVQATRDALIELKAAVRSET